MNRSTCRGTAFRTIATLAAAIAVTVASAPAAHATDETADTAGIFRLRATETSTVFRFRALTYNCGSGATIPLTPEGIRRIAEEIIENRADIVGICEFDHGTDWYDGRDMFAELRVALADRGYPMHSFETGVFPYENGWFAHGLLSRWAIVDSDRRVIWEPNNWKIDRITVEPVPGVRIDAMMTHIWPHGAIDKVRECFAYANESVNPRLFMGDFNMQETAIAEEAGFREACRDATGKPCLSVGDGATISGPLPRRAQIDFIFVSPEVRGLRAYTHYTSLSDHWPVVAALEVDAPAGTPDTGDNVRDPLPTPRDPATAAWRAGDLSTAATLYHGLFADNGDPFDLYSAGCMELLGNDPDAAEATFGDVVDRFPDSRWSARAAQRLGVMFEAQERFAEAEAAQEEYINGYFDRIHFNLRSRALDAAIRRLAACRTARGRPAGRAAILADLVARYADQNLGRATELAIAFEHLAAGRHDLWWDHYRRVGWDEEALSSRDPDLRRIADGHAAVGHAETAERLIRRYLVTLGTREYHRGVLGRQWKLRDPAGYDIVLAPGSVHRVALDGERHVVCEGDGTDPPSGLLTVESVGSEVVLRVEVADAAHHVAATDNWIWDGDSLQVALDPGREGGSVYDANDIELGFALRPGDGHDAGEIVRAVWKSPPGARPERITARIQRDEAAGRTLYEIRIPPEALGIADPDREFAFGIGVLVNDGDGDGRENFLEWTPGIAYEKAPCMYPTIRVVPGETGAR